VTHPLGFKCRACGERHDELPFSYHSEAPAYWRAEQASDPESELGTDQCVIGGEHFFVRGLITIPVRDAEDDFAWGVWVSLSEQSFVQMSEDWTRPGREQVGPVFAWLATNLPVYDEPTLTLATNVHTQPLGVRPLVELQPTDHPLARQQREGVDTAWGSIHGGAATPRLALHTAQTEAGCRRLPL
jgi:hypothetical protein